MPPSLTEQLQLSQLRAMIPFFNQPHHLFPMGSAAALSGLAASLIPHQQQNGVSTNGIGAVVNGGGANRKRDLDGGEGKEVMNKVQRGWLTLSND
jgi:hypothetical protein